MKKREETWELWGPTYSLHHLEIQITWFSFFFWPKFSHNLGLLKKKDFKA